MKKFLSYILVAALLGLPTQQAQAASFWNSDWFEPAIFCAAAGAVGYTTAKTGEEVNQGAIFCVAAAGIAWLVNQRYKSKYGEVYQEEIRDLRRDITEMNIMAAQKAARGEEDESYSIKIQEIVPGKRLEDGSILAPTLRDRLVIPGEGNTLGE